MAQATVYVHLGCQSFGMFIMSLAKTRLRILQRMAQAQGDTANPQPDTPGTIPATSNNIIVPPDPSPPASQLYPLRNGFDSARVGVLDSLVKQLSVASNVATNGKYNLQSLKNQNFEFDPSEFGSMDQKNLLVLFYKVFQTLLNRGQAFTQPVSAAQLTTWINYLSGSPELAALSQINPSGQVAQKSPISGNFRNIITEQLARLRPTTPTTQA